MIPGVGSIEEHEKVHIPQQKRAKTVEVEVDTVDNLMAAKKIPRPDFVKIDVQGAELDVFIGMSNTIKMCKPKILVEVHSIPHINWRIKNLQRIVKFLMENGYSLYHVESGRAVNSSNAHIIKQTNIYGVHSKSILHYYKDVCTVDVGLRYPRNGGFFNAIYVC